jgi:hypothetical protein
MLVINMNLNSQFGPVENTTLLEPSLKEEESLQSLEELKDDVLPLDRDAKRDYDECICDELPSEIQTAEHPKSTYEKWEELTLEERDAAMQLGHDQKKLDNGNSDNDAVNYSDSTWRKLPLAIQEAAKVLGYTPKLWNNKKQPPLFGESWENLSSKESEAAKKLGFCQGEWRGSHKKDEEAMTNKDEGCNGYDDYNWCDLPDNARRDFEILGYNAVMWEANEEPTSSDKEWCKLGSIEQEAATRLGYNAEKWDNDSDCTFTADVNSIGKYNENEFDEHVESVREAYKILGKEPKSLKRDWCHLTKEEQKASMGLGYTAKIWDDEVAMKSDYFLFDLKRTSKGSLYILLDCISLCAFFATIEAFYGFFHKYFNKSVLNLLKIVVGLAVLRWNGQMFTWTSEQDEQKSWHGKKKANQATKQTPLNSMLNLISYWTIYSGVSYFFYKIENDVTRNLESYYVKIELNAEVMFEDALIPREIVDFTCKDWKGNGLPAFQSLIGHTICSWGGNWSEVSCLYSLLIFGFSAITLFRLFHENFLIGCD